MPRMLTLHDGRQVNLNYFVEWRPWLWQPPVAEKACREVVNLPTHPRATPRTARRAVEFVTAIGPPLTP